jgi:hypothetical protein
MEPLNNSYPFYYFQEKEDLMDVEFEEKNNLSAFNLNFLKFYEPTFQAINDNNIYADGNIEMTEKEIKKELNINNIQNFNNHNHNTSKDIIFSPPKKKNTIDISYSMEGTFCENSNINIEEEFQQNEETYLKIGNEGHNPCIDPIQEVDSFDREFNESFLYENNYLLDNFNDNTNSFEGSVIKFDSTFEETDICKLRKNIMSIKLTNNKLLNKSDYSYFNPVKKQVFHISNNINSNNSGNLSMLNLNLNKSTSNLPYVNNSGNNNLKLNLSCNFSESSSSIAESKKRGRKKYLFDGVKTEILDKAFLREFKSYLKKSKQILKSIYDDLKTEEKIFWNEFMQNNNPPFLFTQNKQKVEYKSFSKNLLKFVFSHQSVRNLYSYFVKDQEKEIIYSIINKRVKKIDRKMLLFYTFYGKNLHKLYSSEFNLNDINISNLENIISNSQSTNTASISGNISDSAGNISSLAI